MSEARAREAGRLEERRERLLVHGRICGRPQDAVGGLRGVDDDPRVAALDHPRRGADAHLRAFGPQRGRPVDGGDLRRCEPDEGGIDAHVGVADTGQHDVSDAKRARAHGRELRSLTR